MKDNREWAHREAKRRAHALDDAISIYRKDGDYIIRTAVAAEPRNGFARVATVQPDGTYSFGSKEA